MLIVDLIFLAAIAAYPEAIETAIHLTGWLR